MVVATLPCGHLEALECGEDIQKYICTVECKQVLPECQHTITKPCYRVQEYVDLSKSFDASKNQVIFLKEKNKELSKNKHSG